MDDTQHIQDGYYQYYNQLYNKGTDKEEFCKELVDNVIQGQEREEATLAQLQVLEDQGQEGHDLLQNLHTDNSDTILNLAAKFHENITVMRRIIDMCPTLLLQSRKGDYEGQTTLHIVISKLNSEAVKMIFKTHIAKKFKVQLLKSSATGSRFNHTVMMGELPFSVAALTLDTEILNIMFKYGTQDMISLQNSYGDTVFHSLIKYSYLKPDKTEQIIDVCRLIHKQLADRPSDEIQMKRFSIRLDQKDPMGVWFLCNYGNQTPLQLATSLEQVEIFKFILNIESVYCRLDRHDGLFDVHLYDITEIDTVTMTKWKKNIQKEKKLKSSKVAPNKTSDIDLPEKKINEHSTRFKQPGSTTENHTHKPILEIICEIKVERAFQLVNMKVIRKMIKKKWSRYRWMYFIWALAHIAYMSVLTWFSVVKTEILKQQIPVGNPPNKTSNTSTLFQCVYACVEETLYPESQENQVSPSQTNENDYGYLFTLIMSILNILIALLIILLEIRRRVFQGCRFHLKQLHHNGSYRLLLCLFAVCLIVDSVWYLISPQNNFLLIFALLVGWWFLTFFLRAIKKFSFFTVMLQKVLMGDAVRFAVIIIIEFLSFTVAMYITFLYTQPEGFQTLGETFLTLFNLMLGLTELNILIQARDPWLAIALFVVFVLVTYVLMLNALIAMMSQTCAVVSENKLIQGEMQRLSVILFLENLLPDCVKVCCGTSKFVKRFDLGLERMTQEERYFLEMDSIQTSYSKGESIVKRRKVVQTMKFDTKEEMQMLLFNLQSQNAPDAPEPESGHRKHRLIRKPSEHPVPQDGGLSPIPHVTSKSSKKTSNKRKSRESKQRSRSSKGSKQSAGDREEAPDTNKYVSFAESDDAHLRDLTDGLHQSLECKPEISTVEH